MTAVVTHTAFTGPTYRTLFPDWSRPRPLSFFFLEELLEARAASTFPTGAEEPDEDVNIYLADLLTRAALRSDPGDAAFGSIPQWCPPAKALGRRARAHWYLRQGEHRLLYLGLFARGEARRRRARLWGMTEEETNRRDLVCGRACYEAAAALLEHGDAPDGLALTCARIARHFQRYVEVLTALGTGRWDLGARLSDRQLATLMQVGDPAPDTDAPREPDDGPGAMDAFLDTLGRYRRRPGAGLRRELLIRARRAGVDPGFMDAQAG